MEKPIFYSQLGEDLFIFKNFINKIVNCKLDTLLL